jgi:hypothetical protein
VFPKRLDVGDRQISIERRRQLWRNSSESRRTKLWDSDGHRQRLQERLPAVIETKIAQTVSVSVALLGACAPRRCRTNAPHRVWALVITQALSWFGLAAPRAGMLVASSDISSSSSSIGIAEDVSRSFALTPIIEIIRTVYEIPSASSPARRRAAADSRVLPPIGALYLRVLRPPTGRRTEGN